MTNAELADAVYRYLKFKAFRYQKINSLMQQLSGIPYPELWEFNDAAHTIKWAGIADAKILELTPQWIEAAVVSDGVRLEKCAQFAWWSAINGEWQMHLIEAIGFLGRPFRVNVAALRAAFPNP